MCLDKNRDDFVAGVDVDSNGVVAKVPPRGVVRSFLGWWRRALSHQVSKEMTNPKSSSYVI